MYVTCLPFYRCWPPSFAAAEHLREAQLVAARRVGGGLIAPGHKSRSARCQGARDKPTSFSLSR